MKWRIAVSLMVVSVTVVAFSASACRRRQGSLGLTAMSDMPMIAWAQQAQPPSAASQATGQPTPAAKPAALKAVRHVAVGKVTALSDTSLTIERTVKGKTETMEFALTKPLSGIAQGDEVRVSYKTEDGKNVVVAVRKVGAKKAAAPPKP